MAEATYDVVANLTTKGGGMVKLVDDAKKLTSGWDQVSSGFDRLIGGAGVFAGALGGIATTAMAIGGTAAGAMLGAAGIGAALVGSAMAELEGKSIQLASVLAAATGTPFEVMQKESKVLFDQFRNDAIESAGETRDFVDVAAKIAGPLAGAGKSMEDLHRITKGVVEMAPSLGIAFDQAGSDVMRMLQGTAGIESPLFRAMVAVPSLGIQKAEEFNKLSPEKRVAKLEQALSNPAFRAAAAAYGNSWKGLTSTFEDATKAAGIMLGEPLFAVAKRGLSALNRGVMDFAQGQGGKRLRFLGLALASDFEALAAVMSRIFPGFERGGMGALDVLETLTRGPMRVLISGSEWVVGHWAEIKSHAHAAADAMAKASDKAIGMVRALGGGDMAKGLERMAEIGIGAKIAAPAASMAVGGAGVAMNGARLLGMGAAGAGATEAAAVGGAGATAAAAGAGAGGLAASLAATGPVALGVAAAIAWVGAAFVTFKTDLAGMGTRLSDIWLTVSVATTKLGKSLGDLWESLEKAYKAAEPLIALLGTPLVIGAQGAGKGLEKLISGIEWFVSALGKAIDLMTPKLELVGKALGLAGLTTGRVGKPGDMGFPEAKETEVPDWAKNAARDNAWGQNRVDLNANKGLQPKPQTMKVEITHKWDLGEGNEDAIYVASKKAIRKSLRDAQSVQRTSRMRGA